MKKLISAFLLTAFLFVSVPAKEIHHYVYFNRDRERISEKTFLETKAFEGAQLKYTWRELEPKKDSYDFSEIRKDLAFLKSKGKKLFIQLQDVSFHESIVNVPQYLIDDKEFGGGAIRDYQIDGDEEKAELGGWVPRRWDPAVRERFQKLLLELGKEFDGKIEGINLPETAVSFGWSGKLFPKDFTPAIYRDAVIENMRALRRAFPRSVAMQYANFMPGEWLPKRNKSYLQSVYQEARNLKMSVGGPDLLIYRPGQMDHSYPLIRDFAGVAPTGLAVQWGDYEEINPKTGKQVTIPEMIEFASEYLKLDYLFWETQEPFYSKNVIPYLKNTGDGNKK